MYPEVERGCVVLQSCGSWGPRGRGMSGDVGLLIQCACARALPCRSCWPTLWSVRCAACAPLHLLLQLPVRPPQPDAPCARPRAPQPAHAQVPRSRQPCSQRGGITGHFRNACVPPPSSCMCASRAFPYARPSALQCCRGTEQPTAPKAPVLCAHTLCATTRLQASRGGRGCLLQVAGAAGRWLAVLGAEAAHADPVQGQQAGRAAGGGTEGAGQARGQFASWVRGSTAMHAHEQGDAWRAGRLSIRHWGSRSTAMHARSTRRQAHSAHIPWPAAHEHCQPASKSTYTGPCHSLGPPAGRLGARMRDQAAPQLADLRMCVSVCALVRVHPGCTSAG